jgi:glycosyltransferase involved in cell wall biosynthesis
MGSRARDQLIGRGFDPGRVVAIPASVDEKRFRPRPSTPRWDVVAVAELISTKRLHDLVDAAALVVRQRPDLEVAVAGTGPLRAELVERAERAGVAEHVTFLGFRDDVPELYAQARVFVLPSRSEGLSVSLLEAMASGLPAVVSDVGEARDLVDDGTNGFLYPPGDVSALSELLLRLLGDPALCRQVGARAACDAVALAGRPAIAAAYRSVLARAAAEI